MIASMYTVDETIKLKYFRLSPPEYYENQAQQWYMENLGKHTHQMEIES